VAAYFTRLEHQPEPQKPQKWLPPFARSHFTALDAGRDTSQDKRTDEFENQPDVLGPPGSRAGSVAVSTPAILIKWPSVIVANWSAFFHRPCPRTGQENRVSDTKQELQLLDEHFQRLIRCLDYEAAAETRAVAGHSCRVGSDVAERSGASLVGLAIRDETSGFGGRVVVTLGKRDRRLELPWTRLNAGTPVVLSEEQAQSDAAWRGIVNHAGDGPPSFPELSTTRI